MRTLRIGICLALLMLVASVALGCFGTMLKIGVEALPERSLASYATGYFIAEKTGIEPDFVNVSDPAAALERGEVDLIIVPAGFETPKNAVIYDAGKALGASGAKFAVRKDVLDDLRFTTVQKALSLCAGFFGSKAYSKALSSTDGPKAAARKAVNDGA